MSIIRILKEACVFVTFITILVALSACATIPVQIEPKEQHEVYLSVSINSTDTNPLIGGSDRSLPEGKLFVIEHVNGYIRAPSGQKPIQLAISLNPGFGTGTMTHQLIPVFLGSDPNAPGQPDRYAVSQTVKWYASKGVRLLLVRTDSSWVMRADVTLTGYLID